MDRSLYVSAVGLTHVERVQGVKANNLANVSTDGFKADLTRFMSKEIGGGHHARVYGVAESGGTDLSRGLNRETGRALDVAVLGDGMFSVVREDGTEVYTRTGSFQVDALGRMMTQDGNAVMGRGGLVILPPYENIMIATDGVITIRPQGQGPDALVQINQLKLVDPEPEEVRKDGTGAFQPLDERVLNVAPNVRVQGEHLESSNVNAISELTEIITLARQFELGVKLMQNSEQNDEAATQLLRVG